MPTGYTSEMYNGKEQTFKEFAMKCARQFGACIRMRDEPSNIEIPVFEPDDYHLKALEKSRKEQANFNSMSEDQLRKEYKKLYDEETQAIAKQIKEYRELRQRYNQMLDQAKAWVPPTPDHKELKKFMIEQLQSSIDFDCNEEYTGKYRNIPASFEEWKKKCIDKFAYDEEYHNKGYEKECANVARSNAWIKALKDSL